MYEPDHVTPTTQCEEQYNWLRYMAHTTRRKIQHDRNSRLVRIGKYLPDGFVAGGAGKGTCYEFNGCYWHGHPNCQKHSEKQTRRYEKTLAKEKDLKAMGYDVVSTWECEWKALQKRDYLARRVSLETKPQYYKLYCKNRKRALATLFDPAGIQWLILNDQLFGLAEVDIHVPDSLYAKFSEMSPIFATVNTGERRQLVGGMKAENILLSTPLLKWYLSHGLVVTKVHKVYEFAPKACFKSFVDRVTQRRQQGDVNPSDKVSANLWKLVGNSAYGSLIMNKERHVNTTYTDKRYMAARRVNWPRFRNMEIVNEDMCEISTAKKTIRDNMPVHVGKFVLDYAKLRMLQFYYDVVDNRIPREHFQYLQMDTDSAYMAVSAEGLKMMEEAVQELTGVFVQGEADKRHPGKFKLEFSGTHYVGLCSKTYAVSDASTCAAKKSHKGIPSNLLPNDCTQLMSKVLKTKEPHSVVTTQMNYDPKQQAVVTKERTVAGITAQYDKRLVVGNNTLPLDMILCCGPRDKTTDRSTH
jgi:hypothetical protein